MMKHFNFSLNRILVFAFTTTMQEGNFTMNLGRNATYSEVRVIVRDMQDNLLSNEIFDTNSVTINLTGAGQKKVQFRISNPNNVVVFDMAINGENSVPIKSVNLDEFRKFVNLERIVLYGENEFYYLPESLSGLKGISIYGFNTIARIPDTFVNLEILEIRGYNQVDYIPETLTKLFFMAFHGANTIPSVPDNLIDLETIDIQGSNTIGEVPSSFTKLKNLAITGLNTISFLSTAFTELNTLSVTGNNTISVFPDFPKLVTAVITGQNTISALPDFSMMPFLWQLIIGGKSTITFDIADLPDHLKDCRLQSGLNEFTYSGKSWPETMSGLVLWPKAGYGLTTAMVDQLLIDLQDVAVWNWPYQVDLREGNGARTGASNAAVANLVSKGVTVLTN